MNATRAARGVHGVRAEAEARVPARGGPGGLREGETSACASLAVGASGSGSASESDSPSPSPSPSASASSFTLAVACTFAVLATFSFAAASAALGAGRPRALDSLARTVSAAETIVLTPEADAYVDQSRPATNFDTAAAWPVEKDDMERERYPLLRFDLSAIPADSEVVDASIELWLEGGSGEPIVDIEVQRITLTWDEATVTWNNRPPTQGRWASWDTDDEPGWRMWDVRVLANNWVRGAAPNHGLVLRSGDDVVFERIFESTGSRTPRLVVEYEPPTPTATSTATATATPSATASVTTSATATATATPSATSSATPTELPTPTVTESPTATQTPASTDVPTATATSDSTATATTTSTPTPSPTATATTATTATASPSMTAESGTATASTPTTATATASATAPGTPGPGASATSGTPWPIASRNYLPVVRADRSSP